ncbi:hypothetical protein BJV74DRAFT_867900 [Russula compacta]|nr:hypothetical protein BJV74DRAFT_867900 [Russula compacta]
MVDWQNPTTILQELGALVKVIHVVDGVYLWEFICNLGFEWALLSGRRQWRWTAFLYIACRVATISSVVTELVGLNITNQINCKLWTYFVLFFSYAATTFSLSLYALRGIAVWQRLPLVIGLSAAVVLANVGAWVRRVILSQASWQPLVQVCMWQETQKGLFNNGLLLATEVFFIALIASGISKRNSGLRALRVMYREGLLWLVVAALVQVIPVVFLILNLNDPMNIMFVTPSIICTSIGATRMYRTLSDRQAGNILDFWETSRDETTGEIRFRRQTQFITRTDGPGGGGGGGGGGMASTTALPMGRLVRTQPQPEERFVERFEARDIDLDDDGESTRDAKPSIAVEDQEEDKPVEWVHAK